MTERLVVNDSYPIELFALVDNEQVRDGKSVFWSSAEADGGTESLRIDFNAPVYFNRVTMKAAQKPCTVKIFYSADATKDESLWEQLAGKEGLPITKEISAWGTNPDTDSMVIVDFQSLPVFARAIRIVFERVNGEQMGFPYSIDITDLVVLYEIEHREDYLYGVEEHSFDDVFMNHGTTSVEVNVAENAVDGNESYWLSAPNVTSDAVECMYFSFGEEQSVDTVTVDPVYAGAAMNIYFSNDDLASEYEDKEWTPVTGSYRLSKRSLRVPLMSAKYIKLEFSDLTPIPYTVMLKEQYVRTRKFPRSVDEYFRRFFDGKTMSKQTDVDRLLYSPTATIPYNRDAFLAAGIPDPDQKALAELAAKEAQFDTGLPIDFPEIKDSLMFQSQFQEGAAADSANFRVEGSIRGSSLSSFDATPTYKKFFQRGVHEYRYEFIKRDKEVAYVVGIREVRFSLSTRTVAIPCESFSDTFFETFSSPTTPESNTWQMVNNLLLKSANPSVYVSADYTSVKPFRSFSFAAQESKPEQFLSDPSFTNGMGEDGWDAYPTDSVETTLSVRESLALHGNCLFVARTAAADTGGAQTEVMSVPAGGTARISGEIYVAPTFLSGSYRVAAIDDEGDGNVLAETRIYPSGGRWIPFSLTFKPEPFGKWWASSAPVGYCDYLYRKQIIIEPPVGVSGYGIGTAVLVQEDTDLLRAAGKLRTDGKDWRVVFYDGKDAVEIDYDQTANNETWFKLQRDIPAGVTERGYFLYYGNSVETTLPMRNIDNVFAKHTMAIVGDYINYTGDNVLFGASEATKSVVGRADGIIGGGAGSIALLYTPAVDFSVAANGHREDGSQAVRFLVIANTSVGGKIALYFYNQQLWFSIVEPTELDGSWFENTVACDAAANFPLGAETAIIATWGASVAQGTRRDMALHVNGVAVANEASYYGSLFYNGRVY